MNKIHTLENPINGFNLTAEFIGIEKTDILEDMYKDDYRGLCPKFEIVVSYKNQKIKTTYSLNMYNLGQTLNIEGCFYEQEKYNLIYEDAQIVSKKRRYNKPRSQKLVSGRKQSDLSMEELTYQYSKNYELNNEELLYMLRNFISDMSMKYDYDRDEFAGDIMGVSTVSEVRKADEIYQNMNDNVIALGVDENILYNTLMLFTSFGIE